MRKIFKTVEVLLVTTPPHACMPSDSFASRISAVSLEIPRNSRGMPTGMRRGKNTPRAKWKGIGQGDWKAEGRGPSLLSLRPLGNEL